MNACSLIHVHIHCLRCHSITALLPCVADPSWSLSLRALHSASGLHHSTDSLVVICYLSVLDTNTSASTYSAFRPISPFGLSPTSSKGEMGLDHSWSLI